MKRRDEKSKNNSNIIALSLILRYTILIIIGLNINFIYKILTPLTINISALILRIFDSNLIVNGSIILFKSAEISLIPACIAGSAYFLLLILNLSVSMNFKIRIKSLLFILISFFILNVLRIVIFSNLFISGFNYFDISHQISWYIGSTALLLIIWFVNIKMFKINNIPIFTDVKYLISQIRK